MRPPQGRSMAMPEIVLRAVHYIFAKTFCKYKIRQVLTAFFDILMVMSKAGQDIDTCVALRVQILYPEKLSSKTPCKIVIKL